MLLTGEASHRLAHATEAKAFPFPWSLMWMPGPRVERRNVFAYLPPIPQKDPKLSGESFVRC